MEAWVIEQGTYFIQVVLAGLCGIAIGAERQSRMKSAGVRTHFMVAVASAVMMIISKFGFMERSLHGYFCDLVAVICQFFFIFQKGMVKGQSGDLFDLRIGQLKAVSAISPDPFPQLFAPLFTQTS